MTGSQGYELGERVRPFSRHGFFRRTVPFGGAAAIGLTILLLGAAQPRPGLLAVGLAGLAVIWLLAYVVPWHALPSWLDNLPPLLMLGLFVGIRNRLDQGLPAATIAPLFLVPTFWVALFGTKRALYVLLGSLAFARVGLALVHGSGPDIAHATVAVVISAVVCVLAHEVVSRLRSSEQSVRTILDRLPVGFAILQRERITYANEAAAKALGYSAAELGGREVTELLHEDERSRSRLHLAEVLRGQEVPVADRRFRHRDGGEIVQETAPMRLEVRGAPAVGVMVRDVTDERLLEAAEAARSARIAHEREQFAATLGAVRDGVVILDHQRRGIYANPAYLELFGVEERRIAGLTREAFIEHAATLAEDPSDFAARMGALDVSDDAVEFRFARPRRRIMRRTVRKLRLPDGDGFLVVWHDVTADLDLVIERERQALTDALTGLPNRRAAEDALRREKARARRQGSGVVVALFDIDHFKAVNDRFGHDAGDRVLAAVGKILSAHARVTDVVARWGGEEFLAILSGDVAGALAYCERVRDALAQAPIAEVGTVTISGGLAAIDVDEDPRDALRRADERLYQAKRAGRDRIAS